MQFDLQRFLNATYGRHGGRKPPRPLPASDEQTALRQMGLAGLSMKYDPDWPLHLRKAYGKMEERFPHLFVRNAPGYIESRPHVRFRVRRRPKDEQGRVIKGEAPVEVIERVRVGVATLMLITNGTLDLPVDRFREKIVKKAAPLLALGPAGADFVDLVCLISGGLHGPDELIQAWADWLERALTGHESSLVSIVCPDYATEPVEPGSRFRRYTFDSLGEGVGLVSQRVVETLPLWHAFAQRYDIKLSYVICMADHEADSQTTLERVGLNRDEFLRRCRLSQVALSEAIQEMIPVINGALQTPFFTEAIGGRARWENSKTRACDLVERQELTGAFSLGKDGLRFIIKKRGPMLRRWWPDQDEKISLLTQSVEYGAAGLGVFSGSFPNPLMLGADSPFMSPFVQMGGEDVRPVVYMKAIDY